MTDNVTLSTMLLMTALDNSDKFILYECVVGIFVVRTCV